MAIKTTHNTFDQIWFVTFTCFNWLPLFEITKSYDLVYKWLKYLRENNIADTLGFVIMPNHIHALLFVKTEKPTLNTFISNAKRFMAYAT